MANIIHHDEAPVPKAKRERKADRTSETPPPPPADEPEVSAEPPADDPWSAPEDA